MARYEGMTPMGRFLVETGQGEVEAVGIEDGVELSDTGATYGGSMDGNEKTI